MGKQGYFWFLADFRINSTNDNEQIKTTKRNKKYNREVKWNYYRPYFIYIKQCKLNKYNKHKKPNK